MTSRTATRPPGGAALATRSEEGRVLLGRLAVEDVGHEDEVVAGRKLVEEEVAFDDGDAAGEAPVVDVVAGQGGGLGQLEDRRAQVRVVAGEAQGVGARAAADVEDGGRARLGAAPWPRRVR